MGVVDENWTVADLHYHTQLIKSNHLVTPPLAQCSTTFTPPSILYLILILC